MKLKIALSQMNTCLGCVEKNLEKSLATIEEASSRGAELVLFPELSLTGYVLQDLASTVAHYPIPSDPVFKKLLAASKKLDVVVGFVEEDSRNRFFISSAYLSEGKVLHVHRKVYLPTYGLFDEGRFFAWGDSISAFDTRFGRIGMLICEDFWHASLPYLLWLDGADLMLFNSASPGRGLNANPQLDSARWVDLLLRGYAGAYTVFIAHANRVGFEDGLHFWGGSAVYNPNGEVVAEAAQHKEELLITEINLDELHHTRSRLPILRDERTAVVQRELQRILTQPGKGEK